jgi:hypothetical protein
LLKLVSDCLRFVTELITLIMLVIVGFQGNTFSKIIIGICVPFLIILFWSVYMAPMSVHRLRESYRLIYEVIIFGGTIIAVLCGWSEFGAMSYGILVFISMIMEHTIK